MTLPAETRNAIWAIGGTVYAADSKSVFFGFESQIAHHKKLFDFFKKLWYNIYVEKNIKHKNMAVSSKGLGYKPLKLGIVGSNPRIVTNSVNGRANDQN